MLIAPVIVVLSVVVKLDMLSLQSDRLLWRDSTHARMVHGSSLVHSLHKYLDSFGAINVCDLCLLEKIDKSVIYTARYHDLSRVFLLIFTIQFLHGSGAGDLEQRYLQWRVP